MSTRQRLCTVIVTLFGVLLLALGPFALLAPTATAAPGGPLVTDVNGFPFDEHVVDDASKKIGTLTKDDKADKAEKLSGGVAGKVIDLVASIAKCALNLMTPSVKCQL